MKKTLLSIFSLCALFLSSCSDDSGNNPVVDYVVVNGTWEMHVTGASGNDSVIYDAKRYMAMTWSEMDFDSVVGQKVISSQMPIGNGTWKLYSYINGNTPGKYTLTDQSYAIYSYTTTPNGAAGSTRNIISVKYALTGDLEWKNHSQKYGDIDVNMHAVGDSMANRVQWTEGKSIEGVTDSIAVNPSEIDFVGSMQSALQKR